MNSNNMDAFERDLIIRYYELRRAELDGTCPAKLVDEYRTVFRDWADANVRLLRADRAMYRTALGWVVVGDGAARFACDVEPTKD